MISQFAYLVLFSWPVVVVILFSRLGFREALCWSIISGYLLLPNIIGFDVPLVPPYDKQLVVNFWPAVMCIALATAAMRRKKIAEMLGRSGGMGQHDPCLDEEFKVRRGKVLFWTLIGIMFCATVITATNNGEALIRGTRVLRGLKMYDVLSINLALLITIIPFLLGRRFLSTPESHVILLKVMVVACIGYSLLALWEVRMSPQLNKQFYGFGPHRWSQAIRGDSYRPIVFMQHGLWLAIILVMGTLSAMALWREKLKESDGLKWLLISLYLFGCVFLINSLGAFLIIVMLLPLVFFLGIGMQLLMAAIISGIILTYPLLRGSGLVPTDAIYNATAKINVKRADSLLYRFENEEELLAHANAKPVAGWGTWGRNRVFNERGGDIAATDGYWVIIVGVYGWLGYIAQFGLLGLATIFLAARRRSFEVTAATAGIAMAMAAALIDLIPNATQSPVTWLFAGALMGRYQTAVAVVKEKNVRKAAQARTRGGTTEAEDETPDASEIPGQTVTTRLRGDRPLHQRRPREG